jgi:hypothetical protein
MNRKEVGSKWSQPRTGGFDGHLCGAGRCRERDPNWRVPQRWQIDTWYISCAVLPRGAGEHHKEISAGTGEELEKLVGA